MRAARHTLLVRSCARSLLVAKLPVSSGPFSPLRHRSSSFSSASVCLYCRSAAERSPVAHPEDWGSYYEFTPNVSRFIATCVGACLGKPAPDGSSWLRLCKCCTVGRRATADRCLFGRQQPALRVEISRPASPVMSEEFHDLPPIPSVFLGANGIDWAVALLAAWTAGKTVVPLPSFFSRQQLEHVCRDAVIEHIVADPRRRQIPQPRLAWLQAKFMTGAAETLPPACPRRRDHRLYLRQHRPAKRRSISPRTNRPASTSVRRRHRSKSSTTPICRCCRFLCCLKPSAQSACRCLSEHELILLPRSRTASELAGLPI